MKNNAHTQNVPLRKEKVQNHKDMILLVQTCFYDNETENSNNFLKLSSAFCKEEHIIPKTSTTPKNMTEEDSVYEMMADYAGHGHVLHRQFLHIYHCSGPIGEIHTENCGLVCASRKGILDILQPKRCCWIAGGRLLATCQ